MIMKTKLLTVCDSDTVVSDGDFGDIDSTLSNSYNVPMTTRVSPE